MKRMQNVLQLRSAVGFFGAENMVVELAKGLQKTSYHPIIGIFETSSGAQRPFTDAAEKNEIQTVEFPCRGQFDLKSIKAIKSFASANDIGIIHSHGYKANFYALAATRGLDIPTVATCHPWTETTYSLKARGYTWVDKFLLKRFDRIVAVSEEVKKEIGQSGISRQKVSVIANGIDAARFNLRYDRSTVCAELKVRPEQMIIGTIGRLIPEKGHDLLIETAQRLANDFPQAVYLIVGDGQLRQHLADEIKKRGLEDKFIFVGVSDQIPMLLSVMNVFVLPSYREGLPMVILEAMAAGKAIVATNVGAIPNVVIDHQSGLIVKPEVMELAAAISYVLTNTHDAGVFGENASERVKREFSFETMTSEYVDLYDALSARDRVGRQPAKQTERSFRASVSS